MQTVSSQNSRCVTCVYATLLASLCDSVPFCEEFLCYSVFGCVLFLPVVRRLYGFFIDDSDLVVWVFMYLLIVMQFIFAEADGREKPYAKSPIVSS